jgi:hypothetical protein
MKEWTEIRLGVLRGEAEPEEDSPREGDALDDPEEHSPVFRASGLYVEERAT